MLKIAGKTFSSDLRKPCLITGKSLSPPTKIDPVQEKITYYIVKQYFWHRDFQHGFQRVKDLWSHRPILSDATLKNFSQCNAMQQLKKMWPLSHVMR